MGQTTKAKLNQHNYSKLKCLCIAKKTRVEETFNRMEKKNVSYLYDKELIYRIYQQQNKIQQHKYQSSKGRIKGSQQTVLKRRNISDQQILKKYSA